MRYAVTAAILVAALLQPAAAQEFVAGDIRVLRPWSRALPPVSANGAAYLGIENRGDAPDRLTGASSPVAERAELHTHVHGGGMMRMQQVPGVDVPAKGAVSFEPGGMHVMLFGLARPLVAGEHFPLTLRFERAGEVEVRVDVTAGDAPPGHGTAHGGHRGGHAQMPAK